MRNITYFMAVNTQ